jgi:hypothetical protein
VLGQKFREEEEEKNKVTAWLGEQAEKFYDSGIQKLVPRLSKYLDKGGDYVEK